MSGWPAAVTAAVALCLLAVLLAAPPREADAARGVPTLSQFIFNQDRTIRGGRTTRVKVFCPGGLIPFTWGFRPISLPQRGVANIAVPEAVIPDGRGPRAGFTIVLRNPNRSLGATVQVRVSTMCVRGSNGIQTRVNPNSRVFRAPANPRAVHAASLAKAKKKPSLTLDAARKTVEVAGAGNKRAGSDQAKVVCDKGELPLDIGFETDKGRAAFDGAKPARKGKRVGYAIRFANEERKGDEATAYLLCAEPTEIDVNATIGRSVALPAKRGGGVFIDTTFDSTSGVAADGAFEDFGPNASRYTLDGLGMFGGCPTGRYPLVGPLPPEPPSNAFAMISRFFALAKEGSENPTVLAFLLLANQNTGEPFEDPTAIPQAAACATFQGVDFVIAEPPEGWPTYAPPAGGGGGGGDGGVPPTDTDGDGIADSSDNCPNIANADQTDTDGDGLGDVCDADPGGDVKCADGADNDGDGDVDLADRDCFEAADTDESGDQYMVTCANPGSTKNVQVMDPSTGDAIRQQLVTDDDANTNADGGDATPPVTILDTDKRAGSTSLPPGTMGNPCPQSSFLISWDTHQGPPPNVATVGPNDDVVDFDIQITDPVTGGGQTAYWRFLQNDRHETIDIGLLPFP